MERSHRRQLGTNPAWATPILVTLLALAACSSSTDPQSTTISAEQFRRDPTLFSPPAGVTPAPLPPIASIPGVRRADPEQMGQGLDRVAVIVGAPELPSAKNPATPAALPSGSPVVADVLVGQINGKPVFASEILDPLEGKMRADLKKFPDPGAWIREQSVSLQSRIFDRVKSELVLGEARARLTPEERVGISTLLGRIQGFVAAQSGGSLEQAKADIERRSGESSLDQYLANERDQLLIQRTFQESVAPKIRVPWTAVARYYREHPERFNPPGEAILRLVMIDAANAEALAATATAAQSDEAFRALAASDRNNFLRDKAGERRFPLNKPASEWQLISSPEVNASAAQLAPGQSAGPFNFLNGSRKIWIRREADIRPPAVSIEDAQIDIQRELLYLKNAQETGEFYQTLLGGSSFTPIDQMGTDLLALAAERHLGGPWAQRIRDANASQPAPRK